MVMTIIITNNNYYKYFQSCNGLTELTFVFFFLFTYNRFTGGIK